MIEQRPAQPATRKRGTCKLKLRNGSARFTEAHDPKLIVRELTKLNAGLPKLSKSERVRRMTARMRRSGIR